MKPNAKHVLLFLLVALAGCGNGSGDGETIIVEPRNLNRTLDLLVVIDETTSMAEVQDRFAAEFATLVGYMDAAIYDPTSLRIAVVSSDPTKDGQFQNAARITDCEPPADAPWLSYVPVPWWKCFESPSEGECFQSNYFGETATTLECIGSLGASSTSPSQPFAMVKRALTREGQELFVRQGQRSLLAVVIWTANDDESPETSEEIRLFLESRVPNGRPYVLVVAPDSATKLHSLDEPDDLFTNVVSIDGDWGDALSPVQEGPYEYGCATLGIAQEDIQPDTTGHQPNCVVHLLDDQGERKSTMPRCAMDQQTRPASDNPLPCWWAYVDNQGANDCVEIVQEQLGGPAIETMVECRKADPDSE